ncbi:ABC transporter substrate-binding protein [Raineyella sp. LH-20]|uniref:ABC transporter substrate-binding protein n=1 Tax=Raineyella sp. LH-20 TaxID=3081204 RepID=UPI002952F7C6|nr:ABC transporter substrate-binding protein [Raineyella sp. LH-20]WOP18877.1 ABC transporter substrate-binding protein [Raineyella sp. LH-20]
MRTLPQRLRAVAAVLAATVAATTLAGCSGVAAGATSCEGVKVEAGITNSLSDALLYIAKDKGYFAAEGLNVTLRPFKSAGEMIPYLAAGHLAVGAGAPSAGFYNGIARGIDVKIVADKGELVTDYDYMPLLVRKELVDSGRVKSVADLKGLSVAEPAPGTATASTASGLLEANGLTYNDVRHTFLGFPDHVAALQNGSVDASLTTEPAATKALATGAAVKLADSTTVYNNQQLAVLLYSGDFGKKQHAAAQCFMNAYAHAARDYSTAVERGKWAGPGADEVAGIIARNVKSQPAAIKKTVPSYVDPDAALNVESLKKDYAFFVKQKLYKGRSQIDFDSLVDTSFVEAAAKTARGN